MSSVSVPCKSAKKCTSPVVVPWLLCPLSYWNYTSIPVYMYGLFMTLALAFFLSTELGELLRLRNKVASLERDIGGLEAIVLNLDS